MTTGVDKEDSEEGTLAVMLERSRRGVPNLLALKERIDNRDTLSSLEISDLDESFERAKLMLHVYDEHPEVHNLVARIVSMYVQITARAMENEKSGAPAPEVDLGS
jgi:hypothetical protein